VQPATEESRVKIDSETFDQRVLQVAGVAIPVASVIDLARKTDIWTGGSIVLALVIFTLLIVSRGYDNARRGRGGPTEF
jgi:hypothetical protein